MTREIHPFTTEADWLALRVQDLTSTDVPALFGLSPYKTKFELWHEKKSGERVQIADNDRMRWGRRLEASVAQGIAEDRGWSVRPFKEYVRLTDERLGSSFDYRILRDIPFADSTDDAILEIKCVDGLAFKQGWTVEDDFIEAPAHIEIQLQHQLLVSGLSHGYIGVLVGGNDVRILERRADLDVHLAIRSAAAEFWLSIASGQAPDPVMPDDAKAIIRLNSYAEPGKLLDAQQDEQLAEQLARYVQMGREITKAQEDRDVLKADLLRRIGDHEKVLAAGFTISAGIVGPAHVEYDREAYRNFRVFEKKAKNK